MPDNFINFPSVHFMTYRFLFVVAAIKLTWLAFDEDHAARCRKVEQLIAL